MWTVYICRVMVCLLLNDMVLSKIFGIIATILKVDNIVS